MTATEKIDAYIAQANDWRGNLLQEIRKLIHEALPEITEEWKWSSPVFSYKGKMICSSSAFKNHVGLNFFNGAFIEDPHGLFPRDSQAKQMRTIKYTKGDSLNNEALKSLLKRAIEFH